MKQILPLFGGICGFALALFLAQWVGFFDPPAPLSPVVAALERGVLTCAGAPYVAAVATIVSDIPERQYPDMQNFLSKDPRFLDVAKKFAGIGVLQEDHVDEGQVVIMGKNVNGGLCVLGDFPFQEWQWYLMSRYPSQAPISTE